MNRGNVAFLNPRQERRRYVGKQGKRGLRMKWRTWCLKTENREVEGTATTQKERERRG